MNNQTLSRSLVYGLVFLIVVIVLWAFTLIGSPAFNRKLSADGNRIENIGNMRTAIEDYFGSRQRLPVLLTELERFCDHCSHRRILEDPISKKPYLYKIVDTYSYELCSDFELSSQDARLERRGYRYEDEKAWEHGVGHHCFKFEIPQRVRKNKDD